MDPITEKPLVEQVGMELPQNSISETRDPSTVGGAAWSPGPPEGVPVAEGGCFLEWATGSLE